LLLFPRERVSKARLGIDKPRSVSDMGKRTISAVEEALERHGKRVELATALAVADISMKPAEFVAMVAVVAVVAGLVGLMLGGVLVALLVAMTVCLAVRMYVRRTKAKRQAAFADQLPDVLQLVTTALRSGYGITQALESVAEEAEEPARSEFAHVLVEARLGRDLSDSMRALAQRMESKDLEWVVSAIDINRETGGNLSEILNTVSVTIRERRRIARHVRTLTAEGRMSARILTALPLLMTLWQWRVNPDHFALLMHGAGLVALIVAGILMVLGAAWVRKIVNSVVL
jgi:tight adherence protein B